MRFFCVGSKYFRVIVVNHLFLMLVSLMVRWVLRSLGDPRRLDSSWIESGSDTASCTWIIYYSKFKHLYKGEFAFAYSLVPENVVLIPWQKAWLSNSFLSSVKVQNLHRNDMPRGVFLGWIWQLHFGRRRCGIGRTCMILYRTFDNL